MNMRKRIEDFFRRLYVAAWHNPVEVLLAVLFCGFGCMLYETDEIGLKVTLSYFPVLFLLTYTLNSLTDGTRLRAVYYLSALFFIPFFWKTDDFGSLAYGVTLVVVQLLYLSCDWRRDNESIFDKGACYLYAMLAAGFLSGVAWALSVSIFFSVQYIFEIWQGGEERFMAYSSSIAFAGIMPLLFLLFNRKEPGEIRMGGRLFDTLLNYVFSPALLIYAAILYLYFIKVTVLWSLPKGDVAYIVGCFILSTFLLKGCQPFLAKRYYDWFFRYSSWIVLPALVMFWVGTCYRINQYGYTEARVYLVAVGLILTGVVGLFFFRRTGHYLYAAVLAIVLLATVTYVPGITAKDIERISQVKRGNYPIRKAVGGRTEFVTLTDRLPVDLTGYETLWPIGSGNGYDGMSSRIDDSRFSLYGPGSEILFEADMDSLFAGQMKKAGLAPTDSIPEELYPDLLRIDLDSALYVVGEISVRRNSKDSAYTVSYMGEGYYLKKRLPLPAQNK